MIHIPRKCNMMSEGKFYSIDADTLQAANGSLEDQGTGASNEILRWRKEMEV
jgi:hypothetical protein